MRNWDDVGLGWATEAVQKQFGDHATDRAKVGDAQLPIVQDVDKLALAGVDVLAWLNASNSMRVRAQAIARKAKKGTEVEALRESVFSALQGVRMTTGGRVVERVVIKRALPDGSLYEGDSEVEFRAAYAAALVDSGVDGGTARTIAEVVTF